MRQLVLAFLALVLAGGVFASCSTTQQNTPASIASPAVVTPSPTPTANPTVAPSPTPTPTAVSTATPTPRVGPTSTPSPIPTLTPTIPTWPIVEVNWEYTNKVVPTPPGVDEIYSGEAEDPETKGDGAGPTKMAIARRIISDAMINGDALSLAIVRNPGNPDIRLVGITIHRNSKFMLGAKVGEDLPPITLESHLYLTTDAEKSWVEIRLPPGFAGEHNSIERVRVSGSSTLLLSWMGGGPFYTQAELTP